MKEKTNKSLKFLFFLFFSLLLSNCAVEDLSGSDSTQDGVNLIAAQTWFYNYQSSTKFSPEFENLVYDWRNSKIEILENDSRAIVVPVLENKDVDESSNKLLYIYPKEGSYESTLYELRSTDKSFQKNQGLQHFSGFISVYNLEKGFIESTKFENSVAKYTIYGEKLPTSGSTNAFGKFEIDPPVATICLGDLYLCNDYHENGGGGNYGSGYVYYVNGVNVSPSVGGSYFNSSHGSGGGGSAGGASSAAANVKSVSDLNTLIDSTQDSPKSVTQEVKSPNEVISKATIGLLPWANIQVEITQAKVGNTYVVQNVASFAQGLTIGYNWNQTSFVKNVSGDMTTVTFSGAASYSFFAEGIGTVYTSQVSYAIVINNTNGKIISGRRLPR